MITAIPMNDDRVASHFTKANYLVFVDERGVEINRVDNPALAANCAGKQKIVDLLVEQQINRVVLRNIGEQMLGKLLARQFVVYQTNCGRRLPSELGDLAASDLVQLKQASEGRQSLNNEVKKKSGGYGCGHEGHEGKEPAGHCFQSNEQHHPKKANCRQREMQGRARGRCCNS
ncbi:NifB/NifX family molybdenum-iron cluster-binding protein [Aeromonas salmonicida]|uniref:NifB/NifX family molybdenum-iron cluster-binding protein n=1 Tax=Aeromonas salmonicida TaxID=645 RepID=UPI0039A6AB1B